MIIKEVYIQSFAGIKELKIKFKDKFNLIYGKNEAGKSSIENFIRIWLYGIGSSRGKINDRKKYMPLDNALISGELTVVFNNKGYTIRRIFGKSKKDDFCEVIDEITGENIDIKYKNEPGRYFFNINCSTFIKTLFIGQLGVRVHRDKEEEILEKITNIYNSGDENISFKISSEKLDKRIKSLASIRKNGSLDILRRSKINLDNELMEAYDLCNKNIEKEKLLLDKNKSKEKIKEELVNLEFYKKHLKGLKLERNYESINKYLIRKNNILNKKKHLESELSLGEIPIETGILDDIEEECISYTNLYSIKKEKQNKLKELKLNLDNYLKKIDSYDILKSLGDNAREKIYSLKLEQTNLENKLRDLVKVQTSIDDMRTQITNKYNSITNINFIENNRKEIENILGEYTKSLKELKYKIQNENQISKSDSTANKVEYSYIFIPLVLIIFVCLTLNLKVLGILMISIVILLSVKYCFNHLLFKEKNEILSSDNNSIIELKQKIDKYEEILNLYITKSECNGYDQFLSRIIDYDNYKNYKENMEAIIKEKEELILKSNLGELKKKYTDNNKTILSLCDSLKSESLDEVLKKVYEFEKNSSIKSNNENKIYSIEKEVIDIEKKIDVYKDDICKKSVAIGLGNVDILELQNKLKDYKEKFSCLRELKTELKNVEEAYLELLGDRNIDDIKQSINQLDKEDKCTNYHYKSEEEVDYEIKKQSDNLLNTEKDIKDLEYSIEKRYLGKREISEIKEQLSIVEEKIYRQEKEYRALNIAKDVLKDSFEEVRKNVIPQLNNKLVKKFNSITGKNYSDAKISSEYELKMRDNEFLFDGDMLSNGAKDQLYLSLRLSFVNMIFKDNNNTGVPVLLDDAFVQYDDERREKALKQLFLENLSQVLFFTCQNNERTILDKNNEDYNLITI